MNVKLGAGVVLVVALASTVGGCGKGNDQSNEGAPQPMPSPTGYSIIANDIYRQQPRDICRQKNDMFVPELMGRIDQALRKDGLGSVERFDHFDVQPNETGKGGQQAAIWVHAVYKGASNTTLVAVGSFEAANCQVGPMKG